MSKGLSGLFSGTQGASMNSTYLSGSNNGESYSDRGIDIPEHIKGYLFRLQNKGDYITGLVGQFNMTDVSIMSKETGVEFAHITIDGVTYLIRGDVNGTIIPNILIDKMRKSNGTWDFHSHPHNDDCIPSDTDKKLIKKLSGYTGQKESVIITPNGKKSTFGKDGIISVSTIPNTIDADRRKALLELFGGLKDD